MKKFSRVTVFLLTLILIFSSVYIVPYAADIVSGDFIFTDNGKTLTLKQYTGKGGAVEVPVSVGGKKVTSVGNLAFAEYYDSTPDDVRLTSVILPSSVTSIGKQAFMECTKLSKVEMIGVRSLGEAAFWYCKGLKKAAVSSELKEIGLNAFGKCDSLTLYTEKGSISEEYAKSNSIKCSALYPEKITLSSKSLTVEKGKSTTLKIKTTPSDVYYKEFIWNASGTNASVSQSGKVTGKNLGTERVSCMSLFGNAVAECIVTVKTPAVKTVTSSDIKFDSMTLSWKKVSGAQGYRLEMLKGDKWVKLTETEKLSYTASDLSANTEYSFRIRAYLKKNGVKYNSEYTLFTAKTLSLGKVKNVKAVTSSAPSLSFSWDKTSKAKGYQIYALDSKGKYVKVGETTDLVFSEKLSANTVRSYKIRAYTVAGKKKVYGSFTSPFTFAVKPSAVKSLTVTEKTKNSISLKWNKVKNASGYGIYSVKNGEYTLIKKVTSAKYTVSSLKSNATYTYSVRAYFDTTLKTVYGNYSESVKATTKPAVSAQQTAANDLTAAYSKVCSQREILISYSERNAISVLSCNGSSSAKAAANAYAETYSVSSPDEYYNFSDGKDESGRTPADILLPQKGLSLSASSIKSCVKEKDGSGYDLNILLKSETVKENAEPSINAHIWGMIDRNEIARIIESDAVLDSFTVTYPGTVITSKINSKGSFDTLTITVPYEIKAVCTYKGKPVETVLTGKIIRNYILTWW